MNIMELIDQNYEEMTVASQSIADFIKVNYQYITYDTLSELAAKIEVSTTTVVRFSKMLGYDGYSSMQASIRDYAKYHDPYNMSERLSKTHNPKRTNIELLNNTFNKDIDNMVSTFNNLNIDDIKETINILINAKNIYVIGYNDSFILASYMALRMGQIRDGIVLLGQMGGMYPFEISSASKDDVLVAYLFPRYSTHTIDLINILRERGLKCIIITSNNIAPVKNLGDIIIPTFVTGLDVKDSIVGPIFLSNFIANAIAYSDYDNALKHLDMAEKILSKGYYLTSK